MRSSSGTSRPSTNPNHPIECGSVRNAAARTGDRREERLRVRPRREIGPRSPQLASVVDGLDDVRGRSEGSGGGHHARHDDRPDEQADRRVDPRPRDERRRDEQAELVVDALKVGRERRMREAPRSDRRDDRRPRSRQATHAASARPGTSARRRSRARRARCPRREGRHARQAEKDHEGVAVRGQKDARRGDTRPRLPISRRLPSPRRPRPSARARRSA